MPQALCCDLFLYADNSKSLKVKESRNWVKTQHFFFRESVIGLPITDLGFILGRQDRKYTFWH